MTLISTALVNSSNALKLGGALVMGLTSSATSAAAQAQFSFGIAVGAARNTDWSMRLLIRDAPSVFTSTSRTLGYTSLFEDLTNGR